MNELQGWLDVGVDYLGHTLSLLFYAAVLLAAVLYHAYELRRQWPHSAASWWGVKLAVVPFGTGLVFAALGLFNTEGMAGLAVFYLGLFAALIVSPLAVAWIAALVLALPRADTTRIAVSLVLSLVVGWFAAAGLGNAWQGLGRGNSAERAEYQAYRRAAERATPVTDEVREISQQVAGLPGGERYIALGFAIAPGYQIYAIDVRTARNHGGGNSESWSGTLGTCDRPGQLFITNVLDAAEWFEVRLRFHAGTPGSMVEFSRRYNLPRGDYPPLALHVEEGQLYSQWPLPSRGLELIGAVPSFDEATAPGVMHPGNGCFLGPVPVLDSRRSVRATLYSEELYSKRHYELPVLPAAPR